MGSCLKNSWQTIPLRDVLPAILYFNYKVGWLRGGDPRNTYRSRYVKEYVHFCVSN